MGKTNPIVEFFRQLIYYHTVKVVQIKSYKLGLLYYAIVLAVLVYVGVYAIWYQRGYQLHDQMIGLTTVKVKGVAYTNGTNGNNIDVWDAQDVVYPPNEFDALFITTNYLRTPNQLRSSSCPSSKTCTADADCAKLQLVDELGLTTGVCNGNKTCDMYAWCPPEPFNDSNINNLLSGVQDFTVLARQTVKSVKFNFTTSNFQDKPKFGSNLFYVRDMLGSFDWRKAAANGTVIAVTYDWKCDLDKRDKNAQCEHGTPTFIPITDAEDKGYNFRYANYFYKDDNTRSRDLYKVWGLRFVFLLSGTASKFNIVPLIINLGSGLALVSVAAVISDLIALRILPGRKFYNQVKFEMIHDKKKAEKNATESSSLLNEERRESMNEERATSLSTYGDGTSTTVNFR